MLVTFAVKDNLEYIDYFEREIDDELFAAAQNFDGPSLREVYEIGAEHLTEGETLLWAMPESEYRQMIFFDR